MQFVRACPKEVDYIRGPKYIDNCTEKISGTINTLRLFPSLLRYHALLLIFCVWDDIFLCLVWIKIYTSS